MRLKELLNIIKNKETGTSKVVIDFTLSDFWGTVDNMLEFLSPDFLDREVESLDYNIDTKEYLIKLKET